VFKLVSKTGIGTYVAEVPIQDLDISMNDLERYELVVSSPNAGDKEQASVSPIDDLGVFILEEVAHLGPASENELRNVFDDLALRFRW
jgi:hypothetical protein